MAFKLVTQSPNMPAEEYLATDSTSYTAGQLLYRDTSTGTLKAATSSAGSVLNIEAIATKTQTTGTGTYIKAQPIVSGTRVTADCTNATAANQLNKAHVLTDGLTVNNTSTSSTDVKGIFIATRIVGASTDKKLYGYIVKLGQVDA